jgi:glycosyltransferase involved in cell wall biosynthesis
VAPKAYPLLAGDENIQQIGGAEMQQVIVAKWLAARGFRVSMVCLDFGQKDMLEVEGITVFRAFRSEAGIPILRFLWPRLTSLWNCLQQANADIYYQRTANVWTGVMVAFCKCHGKKSVFAAANNPDLEPDTPMIRYARDRWIYSYGLRHVDRIFVQNDEQARLCRINLGREAVKVPNCYAVPKRQSADAAEGGYILWVSTIRERKRPELLLELAQALPNLQFKMIGGPGYEPALFESIKTRAGNIRNLQFLGFVPYSRIDEQFDSAILLVNTSKSEGFPNTFLQAWARAIPTISFVDSGASMHGEAIGLRVATLPEMIAAVADLSADHHRRSQEGSRCKVFFEEHHSPERILNLYEQLFQDLAHDKSGARAVKRDRRIAS